jgi:hypothetical protein
LLEDGAGSVAIASCPRLAVPSLRVAQILA